jgi:hypothetical protein
MDDNTTIGKSTIMVILVLCFTHSAYADSNKVLQPEHAMLNKQVHVFDLCQTQQTFMGFGAQLWAYASHEKYPRLNDIRRTGLDMLNMKYIRITRESACIEDLQKTRIMTDELGVKWIYMIWSTGGRFSKNQNLTDIDGFVDFWLTEVTYLYSNNIPVEYIELMNEPDSKGQWSTGITGKQYNEVVKKLRLKLDGAGFKNVGIVGPGLSSLSWSLPASYLEMMDIDASLAMAAWSTHTWDDDTPESGAPEIERHWPKFADQARKLNPDIPVFITEYATKMKQFHGIKYPMPDDYGGWNEENIYPYYSSSNTVPFAVRSFENTLALINSGANVLCYWQLNDEPTEVGSPGFRSRKKKSWGILDLDGQPKPVYHALMTLYPKIPISAKVVKAPDQKDKSLYAVCVTNEEKIVIAVANDETETHSATIQLRNAPEGLKLVEAQAFECVYKGDPDKGEPDKGKIVCKDIKAVFSSGVYSVYVTLSPDSTLTIVCKVK